MPADSSFPKPADLGTRIAGGQAAGFPREGLHRSPEVILGWFSSRLAEMRPPWRFIGVSIDRAFLDQQGDTFPAG